jgi:hypothetical protein
MRKWGRNLRLDGKRRSNGGRETSHGNFGEPWVSANKMMDRAGEVRE